MRNEPANEGAKVSQVTAVYVPFKTIQTAIKTFRPETLPKKLDRSAWPTFSHLLRGQTFNAFKFLGLVDAEGYVQPALKDLVVEDLNSPKFKSSLAEVLKAKYKEVIDLGAQNGTPAQLQEVMRGYGVSGTTLERALRFWTEAAKFAGIPYPDSWKKATGGIVKRGRRGSPMGPDEQGRQDEGESIGSAQAPGYDKTITLTGVGDIRLIVTINPMELKGKKRAWFYEVMDKLAECPTDE